LKKRARVRVTFDENDDVNLIRLRQIRNDIGQRLAVDIPKQESGARH
jgi:hypothetical protein